MKTTNQNMYPAKDGSLWLTRQQAINHNYSLPNTGSTSYSGMMSKDNGCSAASIQSGDY